MKQPCVDSLSTQTWKLPVKATPIAFAFFMSSIMAMLMCLVITGANTGVGPGYVQAVLTAYQLAMPVAFICVMLVRPVVMRLVRLTVRSE
jgi:hypothetical protein